MRLDIDVHHPQGMVRVGGLWWVTTVDIDARKGWLLAVDDDGGLVERIAVGDDVRYHPGGLDFDGESLWIASAEYRPRSTSVVERLRPADAALSPDDRVVFRVDDHIGAIVRLGPDGDLVGWTWGSRRFLRWTADGAEVRRASHPGQFVDYQDGQWIGDDLVLCGGIGTVVTAGGITSIGGIGLLRGEDLSVVREVPFPHFSAGGHAATRNPFFVEVDDDASSLLLHVVPDDGESASILTYSTPLVDVVDEALAQ